MPDDAYRDAWGSYRESVEEIYQRQLDDMIETRESTEVAIDEEEAAIERLLDSSDRLAVATAERLEGEDASDRQLAKAQLVAAASTDFGIANDLMRREEEVDPRGSLSFALPAAAEILDAESPEQIAQPDAEMGADAEAVKAAVEKALKEIKADAADCGRSAFNGILGLQVPLGEALGTALQGALEALGEKIGFWVRKAIAFVLKGVEKLLRLLGGDATKAIADKLAAWLKELKEGDGVATVLGFVWESDRIAADAAKQLADAGEKLTPDRAKAATAELGSLSGEFGKQMKVLGFVVKGLNFLAKPILALPNGAIFLGVGYGAGLSYAVFGGADYADWYRVEDDGFFDRVDGVRHAVATAVA